MEADKGAVEAEGMYRDIVSEFMVDRVRRSHSFGMEQPHYHPYYELYYLISGNCRMFINRTLCYLSAGDIIILPPYQLHKTIYGSGQSAERFTVNFIPEYIDYFKAQCAGKGADAVFSRRRLSVPKEQRGYVQELFSGMLRETLSRDCYSRIQIKSILFQLLAFLGRCSNPEQPEQLLDAGDAVIQEAVQYIYAHHREPLTLEAVAKTAHMSPVWFSKKFHQTVGLGFKEYLTHIRLEDAEELLLTTGMTVTEVGLTCGFSTGNYFGDAFKKARGISPKEFRSARHMP